MKKITFALAIFCSISIAIAQTFSCPDDYLAVAEDGLCSATLTIDYPMVPYDFDVYEPATYNLGGATFGSGSYPSIGEGATIQFNVGTTVVTILQTAWLIIPGVTIIPITFPCLFSVVVTDNQLPTITCVADQTRDTDLDECSYKEQGLLFPTSFSDNCQIISYSNDFTGNASLYNSIFPIGTTTVVWTVTDWAGNKGHCSFDITVEDHQNPTITCPSEIHENSAPGLCGTMVNFTVTASDNCEGTVTMLSIPSSGSYFPIGTTTVNSTATDAAGNASSCSFNVTVTDNIAPTVETQDLTVQLDANGFASIVPADIDNGSADNCEIKSYELDIMDFNCKDISSNPIEVTLTVTDIYGNSASNTANVTVKDEIAPIVETQDIIVQLNENGLATIVPADIDNGSTDACGIASFSVLPNAFSCTNVANNTVTLTVTDVNGNSGSKSAIVTVLNDLPVIDAVTTSSLAPIQLGTPAVITVNFTDDNATEVNIQWGDLLEDDYTTSTGVVNATHYYSLQGVYPVTVTVTDPCGEMTMYDYHFIVVYDPTAGFVTGGGWIFSPEGAYKPDLVLTGKASFGFVSKYKKGSTVPDGNTEFQFKAGNLNFKSTVYEWLVIAGSKAMFKGSGTINGFGNYGFMLSAIDADLTPSALIDKFRIKIWDKDNDDIVVYDNNLEVEDNADPTTEIGGGSIVIHTSETKSAEIEPGLISQTENSNISVYPNPFNDRLHFEFVSPVDVHARIDIFDITGRKVKTIFNEFVGGGVNYNTEFIPLSEVSNTFLYRVTLGELVFYGKVIYNKR